MDALPPHHESQPKAAVVSYASNNFQRYKFEAASIDTSFFDDAKERLRTCENIEQCCEVMLEVFEILCDQQPEKFGDAYALTFGILFRGMLSSELDQAEILKTYEQKIRSKIQTTVEKVITQKPWENNEDYNTLKHMVQLQDSYYPELEAAISMFVTAARESGLDEVRFSVPLLTLTSRK